MFTVFGREKREALADISPSALCRRSCALGSSVPPTHYTPTLIAAPHCSLSCVQRATGTSFGESLLILRGRLHFDAALQILDRTSKFSSESATTEQFDVSLLSLFRKPYGSSKLESVRRNWIFIGCKFLYTGCFF